MSYTGTAEFLVVFIVALLLLRGSGFQLLAAQLEEAMNNLKGGPGSPSHPIPANDSRLLLRKRAKAEAWKARSHR